MRSSLIIAVAVGLAWPFEPSQARETRRLPPSTKWLLDYAEDSCRLSRTFGEGDQRIILLVDQFSPGDWFRMMFVGKALELRSKTPPIKATLRFGPNELESEVVGLSGTTAGLPTFIVEGLQRIAPRTEAEKKALKDAANQGSTYETEPFGAAREKAATRLELRRVLRTDLVLETGPMDKPLAALRQCSWDTVKSWGLDIQQQKSLTRKAWPKRSSSTWFRSEDYPISMIRGGYQGIVNFRVLVDESGTPTSCHIQESTRPKEFDDLVCSSVMKRAHFLPALDAQGKPVRSYWRQTVNFRIAG